MMAFGSVRYRTVLVLLVFCAVHPKATAPQEAGTIQRESIDLQKCGINNPALPKIVSRVTEGEIAIEGYWPWHGGLFHLNDYQCGCTLINELFVLTASHCVYNGDTGYRISEKLVRVKLGMHRLSANDSSSLQTFTVQKIIPHSKFVPNSHKHDVALLRLNGTVSFTNYVQPVCLDLTETIWVEYLADVIGTVVGWGITEKNRISDQLLQAELPIVRYTDCVESNPELYGRLIYSGMYCAGILNDSDRNEDYEEDNIYSLRMEMESDSPQAMPRMGPERTAVRKRTVRCGQGVTLSCKRSAGLAQKKIHWYKVENGSRTFLIENVGKGLRETLVYRDVRYHHAGEYWCQVTSDSGTLYETGLQLTVTSVAIRFQQSEYISYAVHDTLLDTQLSTQFSFEMTFRTSESNALLFHKPPVAGVESWTFSLLLERNRLTLRIVPPGQLEKVFRSVRLQLQPTRWHTVLVSSYDGQGLMALDGQYLLGFEGHLVQQRADRFYIANAPGLRTPGFSGCVSRLMVNDKVLHLDRDFSQRVNVAQCEFCYSEECSMGRCPGGQQHSCINYGCIDQGRQCDGPVGLMPEGDCSDFGPEPSTLGLRFQNNSYVSYRSFLRVVLTVDLQFQLHGLTDGVVLHTAEHRRGFGKFITILVKAGRIEMRFTTDAHLHTIYLESTVKLLTGRWYRLQAGYRDGYVYVQVDKEQEVARSILGTVFPIDRQLVVFVGGVRWAGFINRHRDVKQGLDGCIKELKLSGLPVDLVDDMVESANIRSCQDERR
uniref:Peptidase S1 domain-containing protein n=1 Tax=Anopheles stephensi TaxID=30069 RepID=A0A182YFQ6_ANOST